MQKWWVQEIRNCRLLFDAFSFLLVFCEMQGMESWDFNLNSRSYKNWKNYNFMRHHLTLPKSFSHNCLRTTRYDPNDKTHLFHSFLPLLHSSQDWIGEKIRRRKSISMECPSAPQAIFKPTFEMKFISRIVL